MFEAEAEDQGLWTVAAMRYFLQLFLSSPLTWLGAFPLCWLFSKVTGLNGQHSSGVTFFGYLDLICVLIAGPVAGWLVGKRHPRFIGSGRLIWILPTPLVPGIIKDLLRQSGPSDWVFASGSNEGVGAVLITLPICSAIGYSLGMFIAGLDTASPRRTWLLFAAGIALFALLVPILHTYENRSLAAPRDAALRHVMGQEGLTLSPDMTAACGPEYGFHLQAGTAVHSIERHICGNGSNAFPVEKVRVISGPYTTAEGWVRAWGLRSSE